MHEGFVKAGNDTMSWESHWNVERYEDQTEFGQLVTLKGFCGSLYLHTKSFAQIFIVMIITI